MPEQHRPAGMDAALRADLEARRAAGLYRRPRRVRRLDGAEAEVDGRRVLVFCSNDYLGLAGDARVAATLAEAAQQYGAGSGAAHLISGHRDAHETLEHALAAHLGRQRALLFSTGYMANLGVIDALAGRGHPVFQDRLNHASLLDGARLAGARLERYRHADVGDLQARLQRRGGRERLIVTDGVFSMDGDVAPLADLADTAEHHGAWLMVDDAHGLGVLGAAGRGSADAAGLGPDRVPILVGTLGKALGTGGAFVAGSEALIETLIQRARTYVYTTAMPPAVAAATRHALTLAAGEDWRRERLDGHIRRFREAVAGMGLTLMPSSTPIQPVVIGDAEQALAAAADLEAAGLLVGAIRPPTVPAGTARLRVTLSAAHTDAHLDRLLSALRTLAPQREL